MGILKAFVNLIIAICYLLEKIGRLNGTSVGRQATKSLAMFDRDIFGS